MIQALTRFTFVIAGLAGGYVATRAIDWQAQLGLSLSYVIFLFVILGGALGYVIGGIIGRELTIGWQRIETWLSEVAAVDVILGTIGLVVGLVIAFFLGQPLRLLQPEWLALTAITLLTLVSANVGVSVATSRRHDAIRLLPGLAPVEGKGPSARVVLLDTSAVIDGRFTELRRTGFIPGSLKVPRFVLAELQTLADSADDNRRSRGRRGLDLLGSLPEYAQIEVMEVDYSDIALVDEKLMRLAADSSSTMMTVDFNLTKVARVRGVDVLNLNEAAAALRPTFLPGDTIHLALTRAGKEQGQAVGYLEDGTMVVVADARDRVGKESEVEVTSVLQTSGGRMIFAKLSESGSTQLDGAL